MDQPVEVFIALRDAFAVMTELEDPAAAMAHLRKHARGDSAAGPLFVRLVIEADQGRYSPALLEELNWRLQEHYLLRQIGALRSTLENGDDAVDTQRRLFSLELLLQDVRSRRMNLDPEEGGA